jgi:hypothetical protein
MKEKRYTVVTSQVSNVYLNGIFSFKFHFEMSWGNYCNNELIYVFIVVH